MISYQALRPRVGFGEVPAKWTLHVKGKRHAGNANRNHPALFAFGNGDRMTSRMVWTTTAIKTGTTAHERVIALPGHTRTPDSARTVEVPAVDLPVQRNGDYCLESLFLDGYVFDVTQRIAIKGFPFKPTIGPLQDEHFDAALSQLRKPGVVIEQLFEKGYLTVSGLPTDSSSSRLAKQIARDFPDYSAAEQRSMRRALLAATRITGAGYAEIVVTGDGAREDPLRLIPGDAVSNRNFGIAVAIAERHALVCDYKDGLYSFEMTDDQWSMRERLVTRCNNVVMHDGMAIVISHEKAILYKNSRNGWQAIQTLAPHDYLLRKSRGQSFGHFGHSLAITDNVLAIGNPWGGPNGDGEVYLFTRSGDRWHQSDVILPNAEVEGFGASIAVNDDLLIIGNPATGAVNTPIQNSGSVFVFGHSGDDWKLWAHLAPEGRPKHERFGERVLLIAGDTPTLLVRSANELYRVTLNR